MPKKLTIEEMDELAKDRGGKCISRIYINNCTKLKWECDLGHQWWATPSTIKRGHWCHACGGNKKLTIEDMQELAKSKGGKCLSKKYINTRAKIRLKCSNGHIFSTTSHILRQGKWCPYCCRLKYIIEEKCRYIFEQLTGYKFPKNRKTLDNKQEIDGYCEKLKIGFEYQGEQHYKKIIRISEDIFKYIKILDKKKKNRINYLKKRGKIKEIIFIKHKQATSDEKLEKYIIRRLRKADSSLVINTKVNYSNFYKHLSTLNEIKEIVEKKDGKLLSDSYINNHTKITIQCKNNHVFQMESRNLKVGQWCPHCAGNAKHTLKTMQDFAKRNNGECISNVYKNNSTKLKWKCHKCENELKKSYNEIKRRKYFCKNCYQETGKKRNKKHV